MKKLVTLLPSMLLLTSLLPAFAEANSQVGDVVISVESDLAFIVPQGFVEQGPSASFSAGYISENMLIGVAPLPFTDLETYHQQRLPREMVDGESMTVNDVAVEWFTFKEDMGMCALLVLQAAPGKNLMELSFYPADRAAEEANLALVESVLGTVRCSSQSFANDKASDQYIAFQHESIGLRVLLPLSVVRLSPELCVGDEISVYTNEFVRVHFYGYKATVAEYLENYGMDENNYFVTEVTRNGVHCSIYEPKPELGDQALAYCVAEGLDGQLLEVVFTPAATPINEEACWYYINAILATIRPIE